MDWSHVPVSTLLVLLSVLVAEFSNGWTDAPTGTSAAVASGVLTSRQALWITAAGNFVGLMAALVFGSAVAHTIGKGIVRADLISIPSIGLAMVTTIAWAGTVAWLGLPVSKTHSLLAALAGIGYAQGGLAALLPASGNWHDSGWVAAGSGVLIAIFGGSAMSWFITSVIATSKLNEAIPEVWWRRLQRVTVCAVSSGHGFNDGLKYVGIFTLVLSMEMKNQGSVSVFTVLPWVVILCAIVMGAGTLVGGRKIHERLDGMVNGASKKKRFMPYMGVAAELTSAVSIWQSGFLGIPMSTNHAVVSAMAGAKSADGKVHTGSVVRIFWGWFLTYGFCISIAYLLAKGFL